MVKKKLIINKLPNKYNYSIPVPNFPKFDIGKLHLDILEVKEKRKPGLPLTKISDTIIKQSTIKYDIEEFKKEREKQESNKNYSRHSNNSAQSEKTEDDDMKDLFEEPKHSNENIEEIQKVKRKSREEKVEHKEESRLFTFEKKKEESKIQKYDRYDFNNLSEDQQENIKRHEELTLLRKWSREFPEITKDIDISDFDENTDSRVIKEKMITIKRKILFEKSFSKNKKFLAGFWFFAELMIPYMTGIRMKGFADFNKKMMAEYDDILFEMAYDSLKKPTSQHSPTVQLMILCGTQTSLFILAQVVYKYFGGDVGLMLLNNFIETGISSNDISEKKPVLVQVQDKPKESRLRGPRNN